MKVCFISGSYPPIKCGIGDYAQRLAAALRAAGADVQVITSKSAGPARGSEVQIASIVDSWDVRAFPTVLSRVRSMAPDIVNIQYPTQRYGRQPVVNLLPALIRARLHIPVITTIHEYGTFRRLGRLRIGLSVLTSTGIIVPDRVNLALMDRAFGSARIKMYHIPLGANIEPDPEGFSLAAHLRQRALYGATDSSIVLVYFGFISPSKGIETLLGSFRCIQDKHPETDVHLLMVANRKPSEARYADYHMRVEQAFQAFGNGGRMHWAGYLPEAEVSRYLASADIAVFPFIDGASLRRTTLISALTHGLPIISTLGSELTDDRLNEEHGMTLVHAGDVGALAQAIWDLSSDADRRAVLGERARAFARGFSWPEIAAQTLEVYRKVIGDRA